MIELLVAIAIISILARLPFPALARAKQRAQAIARVSKSLQLGIGLTIILSDDQACPL